LQILLYYATILITRVVTGKAGKTLNKKMLHHIQFITKVVMI